MIYLSSFVCWYSDRESLETAKSRQKGNKVFLMTLGRNAFDTIKKDSDNTFYLYTDNPRLIRKIPEGIFNLFVGTTTKNRMDNLLLTSNAKLRFLSGRIRMPGFHYFPDLDGWDSFPEKSVLKFSECG